MTDWGTGAREEKSKQQAMALQALGTNTVTVQSVEEIIAVHDIAQEKERAKFNRTQSGSSARTPRTKNAGMRNGSACRGRAIVCVGSAIIITVIVIMKVPNLETNVCFVHPFITTTIATTQPPSHQRQRERNKIKREIEEDEQRGRGRESNDNHSNETVRNNNNKTTPAA
jgi:hypothetical protein